MKLQIKTVADRKHAPHRKHWHVKQLERNSNAVFGRRKDILILYSQESCPSWSNPLRTRIDVCCSITNWNLLLAIQKNLIGQLRGAFIFLMTIIRRSMNYNVENQIINDSLKQIMLYVDKRYCINHPDCFSWNKEVNSITASQVLERKGLGRTTQSSQNNSNPEAGNVPSCVHNPL